MDELLDLLEKTAAALDAEADAVARKDSLATTAAIGWYDMLTGEAGRLRDLRNRLAATERGEP